MDVIKNREELGRARRALMTVLVERLEDWGDMESLSEVARAHGARFVSVGRGDNDPVTGDEQVAMMYQFELERGFHDHCFATMFRSSAGVPVSDDENPIICRRDWEAAREAADEEAG